jgi:hypothetical protein
MAKPSMITPEARQYIIDNCSLTSKQLALDIKDKFGVDVSEVAVWEHMHNARMRAEEATRTADMHISKRISEHVDQFVDVIMERYQKEIRRIGQVLDGDCPDLSIGQDKDDPSLRNSYWYKEYAKLFTTLAKDYIAMRPNFPSLEITGKTEEEIKNAFLDACDEEALDVLERIARQVEENEKRE